MNIEVVNTIKRLAIIALASDDDLMETIVLKGGNAIDLTYEASETRFSRPSYDLDFSIEVGDFAEDLEAISARIEKTLRQTYQEHGYELIDYKFINRPKAPPQKTAVAVAEVHCLSLVLLQPVGGEQKMTAKGLVSLVPY